MSKKVAIIMGSDNDLPVVKAAISELKAFGVPSEVHVMSAHRTPELVAAGHTTLPVIGIPIKSSTLDGLDALLATVQMPTGIPVATVAIDGAANAAILAVQMLALSDDALAEQLVQRKKTMAEGVVEKEKKLLAQLEA